MGQPLPGTRGRRRVYLMRHGEVSYYDHAGEAVAEPDLVQLTETGERQADAAAALLAEVPLDRAVCTGMPRTIATAQRVLRARPLDLEVNEALREIRAGDMSGLSREEVRARFLRGMDHVAVPGARFGNGEPFQDFHDRVVPAFQTLLREPGWTRLLLVAHEGTNRMLLSWASQGGLPAAAGFEQDPGCVNIIDVDLEEGEINRRFIKASNLTPSGYAKIGNYMTALEQVAEHGRQRRRAARERNSG